MPRDIIDIPDARQTPMPDAGSVQFRVSDREFQVLELIAAGYTHAQTGRRLGISQHTVDTYVKRLKAKLGPGNKAHLARMAAFVTT